MATLSVLSCKYDGEHLIAKLKVEVMNIKNPKIWSIPGRDFFSNEITLFSPINSVCYKYRVRFYSSQEKFDPIYVSYNDNEKITCYYPNGKVSKNFVEIFEIKEKVLMEPETRNVLADDLRQYSQFTIECKPKTFKVNKAILQARSPVFCAMISKNFKEGKENRVEINDFEPEIVEKMIEFCETDIIKDSKGNEIELFKIARKYQIESFMIYTRELLIATITFENSCELLKLAQMYFDNKLTDFLISWIRHNIPHICKTSGFLALNNDEIAEIFR